MAAEKSLVILLERLSYANGALLMEPVSFQDVAGKQVLNLRTVGRTTGLPREIEIWFVVCRERFYLFAETGDAAGWVKNIRRDAKVTVSIEGRSIEATARVLDRQADRNLWDEVVAIANQKYGWGDGRPVEITPLPSPTRPIE